MLPRLPSVKDFPEDFHTLEKARITFGVVQEGTDWSLLKKKNGNPTHVGKAIINRHLSCIQIEVNNALQWMQKVTGSKGEPTAIYNRPNASDGSQAGFRRSTVLLEYIKQVDNSTRAQISDPAEVALRQELREAGNPVPDSVKIRRIGCLPPLPKYLSIPKQGKRVIDDALEVTVTNAIFTGDPTESDEEDLETSRSSQLYSPGYRNGRSSPSLTSV